MNNNENLITFCKNPIDLFDEWYELAKKNELSDPNAMNFSSVSKNKKPSSRIVLLKSYNKKGFIFFTNSNSKKISSILVNNFVALNFYWKSVKRQIRIEGKIYKISKKESDKYFNSRPRQSKIGAWASEQSKKLTDRSELLKKYEKINKLYKNKKVPRPNYWNGYIVKPNLFEFWQDMPFRLHDRLEYKKNKKGWSSSRLYP
ncbi:MAG: pyridoxamine 5'-phosphate oxidase [Pelagibacteraceae bacterium]|nr:pyridoxamine 5'-phosphate oxidase [Pelagibacteraceae bacterium]|tara:strand:+ start:34712 stop:35317 length:606 start_codon:yes stop_codon:yes gene_type:complete